MTQGKRDVLTVIVVLFAAWWYIQSWTAYRHVKPSVRPTRDNVLEARSKAPGIEAVAATEDDLLFHSWLSGNIDATRYIAFRHYPVFLVCLVILALLAMTPRSKRQSQEDAEASNNSKHGTSQ